MSFSNGFNHNLIMACNFYSAGSKTMQDGWGNKESPVAASRNPSWEDEEEGGGMWNSTGSQGSGSSWGQGSNGGWGQSHSGKKPSSKVGYCWGKLISVKEKSIIKWNDRCP